MGEPEPARGDRGELRVEVVGDGEDAAEQVRGIERVALQDLADQLAGRVEDGVGIVVGHVDGAS